MLQHKYATDRDEARAIGSLLIAGNFVRPVSGDALEFTDTSQLFRWVQLRSFYLLFPNPHCCVRALVRLPFHDHHVCGRERGRERWGVEGGIREIGVTFSSID